MDSDRLLLMAQPSSFALFFLTSLLKLETLLLPGETGRTPLAALNSLHPDTGIALTYVRINYASHTLTSCKVIASIEIGG